ncbi:helix-turn-helix domain-containing protein [Xanthomonas campestris pv. plantaginis]
MPATMTDLASRYAECTAPAALRGQLLCSWRFRQAAVADAPVRVLPDGHVDLIWDGAQLFVAGPDRAANLACVPAGRVLSGVRLAPGAATAVLGTALHTLTDQRVALDALWGTAGLAWQHRLEDGADPVLTLQALCRQHAGRSDPTMVWLFAQLAAGTPLQLAALTATLGISERALRRRCQTAFGYGAKTLERILRLQRFLAIAHRHRTLTDAALAAGYGDAPHLVRDARQLAGLAPRELVQQHAG